MVGGGVGLGVVIFGGVVCGWGVCDLGVLVSVEGLCCGGMCTVRLGSGDGGWAFGAWGRVLGLIVCQCVFVTLQNMMSVCFSRCCRVSSMSFCLRGLSLGLVRRVG